MRHRAIKSGIDRQRIKCARAPRQGAVWPPLRGMRRAPSPGPAGQGFGRDAEYFAGGLNFGGSRRISVSGTDASRNRRAFRMPPAEPAPRPDSLHQAKDAPGEPRSGDEQWPGPEHRMVGQGNLADVELPARRPGRTNEQGHDPGEERAQDDRLQECHLAFPSQQIGGLCRNYGKQSTKNRA